MDSIKFIAAVEGEMLKLLLHRLLVIDAALKVASLYADVIRGDGDDSNRWLSFIQREIAAEKKQEDERNQ